MTTNARLYKTKEQTATFYSFLFIPVLFIMLSFKTQAQKKVSPVLQSAITNISLPAGSKLDKRIITEIAGKGLLQMEAGKLNANINAVEILYLPNASGFSRDSLVNSLTKNEWSVAAIESDNKYALLKRNDRSVLAYLEHKKDEINLYFAELTIGQPATGDAGNTGNVVQTLPPAVQTTEQTIQQTEQIPQQIQQPVQTTSNAPIADGFHFNISNFDDGWTSTVQENWVEVTKGDIKVLLHYPREEEKEYIPQQVDQTKLFWNLLIAPRYSNLTNFELLQYNNSFEPAHFAAGNLTDQNGKTVYVALFSKARSGWIEIITPDRNSFVNQFHVNNPDSYFSEWGALSILAGYNKFAVGPGDLKGKWSNDFSSASSLYNIYTGIYAGATTYASRQTFTFADQKNYDWKIVVAQGVPGATKVDQAESKGIYQLKGNWQITFSNIDKQAKLYNAYFSCIKGARILWLQDVEYGSYTSYGLIK